MQAGGAFSPPKTQVVSIHCSERKALESPRDDATPVMASHLPVNHEPRVSLASIEHRSGMPGTLWCVPGPVGTVTGVACTPL